MRSLVISVLLYASEDLDIDSGHPEEIAGH